MGSTKAARSVVKTTWPTRRTPKPTSIKTTLRYQAITTLDEAEEHRNNADNLAAVREDHGYISIKDENRRVQWRRPKGFHHGPGDYIGTYMYGATYYTAVRRIRPALINSRPRIWRSSNTRHTGPPAGFRSFRRPACLARPPRRTFPALAP